MEIQKQKNYEDRPRELGLKQRSVRHSERKRPCEPKLEPDQKSNEQMEIQKDHANRSSSVIVKKQTNGNSKGPCEPKLEPDRKAMNKWKFKNKRTTKTDLANSGSSRGPSDTAKEKDHANRSSSLIKKAMNKWKFKKIMRTEARA